MNLSTHDWPRRIRAEYDMTVKELVTSFAKDRYSLTLTAGALGIARDTLKRYCRHEGIAFPDRLNLRSECVPKPLKKGIIRNPEGRNGRTKTKSKREI